MLHRRDIHVGLLLAVVGAVGQRLAPLLLHLGLPIDRLQLVARIYLFVGFILLYHAEIQLVDIPHRHPRQQVVALHLASHHLQLYVGMGNVRRHGLAAAYHSALAVARYRLVAHRLGFHPASLAQQPLRCLLVESHYPLAFRTLVFLYIPAVGLVRRLLPVRSPCQLVQQPQVVVYPQLVGIPLVEVYELLYQLHPLAVVRRTVHRVVHHHVVQRRRHVGASPVAPLAVAFLLLHLGALQQPLTLQGQRHMLLHLVPEPLLRPQLVVQAALVGVAVVPYPPPVVHHIVVVELGQEHLGQSLLHRCQLRNQRPVADFRRVGRPFAVGALYARKQIGTPQHVGRVPRLHRRLIQRLAFPVGRVVLPLLVERIHLFPRLFIVHLCHSR